MYEFMPAILSLLPQTKQLIAVRMTVSSNQYDSRLLNITMILQLHRALNLVSPVILRSVSLRMYMLCPYASFNLGLKY